MSSVTYSVISPLACSTPRRARKAEARRTARVGGGSAARPA